MKSKKVKAIKPVKAWAHVDPDNPVIDPQRIDARDDWWTWGKYIRVLITPLTPTPRTPKAGKNKK